MKTADPHPTAAPDVEALADLGLAYLTEIIAIDSQSNVHSHTIPSTEGQRRLSDHLRALFEGLGLSVEQDDYANVLVRIPGNRPGPALALMAHLDTAEGTRAVPELQIAPKWSGGRIDYPANPGLEVSATRYPYTAQFVGEDVVHGPGDAPIGLDDKLGMCQMMALGATLAKSPALPRGDVWLVFRPDEEIGRMAAVVSLARTLAARGVRRGYTIDGLDPFEINVANFNAAAARVRAPVTEYAHRGGVTGQLVLRVVGVKAHGATAKAEGYLNPTVVCVRALAGVDRVAIEPVAFETETDDETCATVAFALTAADAAGLEALTKEIVGRFEQALEPHAWRGAQVNVQSALPIERVGGLWALLDHIAAFLEPPGPTPLLSEDSAGAEGYSNPHALRREGDAWLLSYRLRDFETAGLRAREAHVQAVAEASGLGPAEIMQQYVNMGPALAHAPELVEWAKAALPEGVEPLVKPIRGGTGVDPFLDVGVAIANLGTGYFAPESAKELTSRQMIGRHVQWLLALVQGVSGGR